MTPPTMMASLGLASLPVELARPIGFVADAPIGFPADAAPMELDVDAPRLKGGVPLEVRDRDAQRD